MALSQAYLEWEKQTKQAGIEQGIKRGAQQERREGLISLLTAKFGRLDSDLEALLPVMTELPLAQVTPLVFQLSREELIQRFTAE